MPQPIVPPEPVIGRPKEWFKLLEESSDGLWYLVRTYRTKNGAYNSVYRRRHEELPPGRWEFRVGPHEGQQGVWARNLEGPRVGEDE